MCSGTVAKKSCLMLASCVCNCLSMKVSFKGLSTDSCIWRHPFRRNERCFGWMGGLWLILLHYSSSKLACHSLGNQRWDGMGHDNSALNFVKCLNCGAGWVQWAWGELGPCDDHRMGRFTILDMAQRCGWSPIIVAEGARFSAPSICHLLDSNALYFVQISPCSVEVNTSSLHTTIMSLNHVPTKASWDLAVTKALQMIKEKERELVKVNHFVNFAPMP